MFLPGVPLDSQWRSETLCAYRLQTPISNLASILGAMLLKWQFKMRVGFTSGMGADAGWNVQGQI